MSKRKKQNEIIVQEPVSIQTVSEVEEINLFEDDPSVPESSNKRRTFILVLMIGALILLISFFLYLIFSNLKQKRIQQEALYESIQNKDTFLSGITINQKDVSGMTVSEAKKVVTEDFKEKLKDIKCLYDDTSFLFEVSASYLTSDVDVILNQAIKESISDDFQETLKNAERIQNEGLNYIVTFTYNDEEINSFVQNVQTEIDCTAQPATISSVDKDAHTVSLSDGIKGKEVDTIQLKTLLLDAINNHKVQIDIPVKETLPEVNAQNMEMIEIVTETSFKGSSKNRIYNIKKGAEIINGTIVEPGAVFSANDTLGTRTYSAGWKEANAYMGGTTDVQAGGGVCQISSTIYNSAVKADLEIVSRRNHSMPVDYISKGLDATINSTGNLIDFKFKNNTNVSLVIFTWTEGNSLFAKIVRCPFATDEFDEIKLTAKKVATLHPEAEMEIIYDITLQPGEEIIDVQRRDGSKYQSYKNYYKNGELIKTEELAISVYNAFNGVKRVALETTVSPTATVEIVTPTPSVTSVPTATPNHTQSSTTPEPTSEPTATPIPTQEPTVTAEPDNPTAVPTDTSQPS